MPVSSVLDSDNNPLEDEKAIRDHINRVLRSKHRENPETRLLFSIASFWFKTQIFNADRVPDRPCLFIGNHALFGLDGFVVLPALHRELDRFPRPMGDKFLFTYPQVAKRLYRFGACMGHPAVASALMQHGEDLLVFPGGAHEAVKSKEQRYTLQWKQRLGFVRLAAQHDYPIVPFALVGPDEFYEYLMDSDSVIETLDRLGLWSENYRPDMVPPLLRGMLGGPLPRPQPCFLSFCEPLYIEPPATKSRDGASDEYLMEQRDEVATRIEIELEDMLVEQQQQRSRLGWIRRLATL